MVRFLLICWFLIEAVMMSGQTFEMLPIDQMLHSQKPIAFRQVLPTTKGTVLMATSLTNLAEVDHMQFNLTWADGYPLDSKGNQTVWAGRSDVYRDLFNLHSGIKLMAEGPGMIIYFVTDNNHIGFINYRFGKNAFGFPPFIFPEDRRAIDIRQIWLDIKGNLFIGTNYDTLYIVEDAANINVMDGKKWLKSTYQTGFDKDSNIVITEGSKKIRKLFLGTGVIPTCFAMDNSIDNGENSRVLIGTNRGLYTCDPSTGERINIFTSENRDPLTITHVYSRTSSAFIWVSSLERGMGRLAFGFNNSISWFPYNRNSKKKSFSPIKTFCRKSENEFLIAPLDSMPAVFNMETGKYNFLTDSNFKLTENEIKDIRFDNTETGKFKFFVDSNFRYSKNSTRDIQIDNAGNAYLIRGDRLFIAKDMQKDTAFAETRIDPNVSQVVIIDVAIGKNSYSQFGDYEINNVVTLKYFENNISVLYAARGFSQQDTLEFSWKIEGRDKEWSVMPYSVLDEKLNGAFFSLEPGKYTFRIKVRKVGEDWRKPEATLYIIMNPPFWKTWWFWGSLIIGLGLLIFFIVKIRVNAVRRQERIKAKHEKELIELEAKALRAQMNPHFIFNCLNSIKSLIQDDKKDKSVTYLTTFSKLIRTLFNNADKKEISLHDEIETCKLYLQLEAMRFDTKFSYAVNIDDSIDLKSVQVPALIIQPFIENAIWHGIVPKGKEGYVELSVAKTNGSIDITVDDNGIGREASKQNKFNSGFAHQSKGVNLTQSRLELDNLLQQRQAKLEIVDKKDEKGTSIGTKVTLNFNESD